MQLIVKEISQFASGGSYVVVYEADIELLNGSIIHASGASGGYPGTVTPNTISGTRGILFK